MHDCNHYQTLLLEHLYGLLDDADNQALLEKHLIEKPAPPTIYNPEISDEFSKLILKCLEKKPDKRPQTFHEVLRTMSDIRIYRTDRLGTIEAKPTYRNPIR